MLFFIWALSHSPILIFYLGFQPSATQVCKALLEKGADINLQLRGAEDKQSTAWLMCLGAGNREVAEYFWEVCGEDQQLALHRNRLQQGPLDIPFPLQLARFGFQPIKTKTG